MGPNIRQIFQFYVLVNDTYYFLNSIVAKMHFCFLCNLNIHTIFLSCKHFQIKHSTHDFCTYVSTLIQQNGENSIINNRNHQSISMLYLVILDLLNASLQIFHVEYAKSEKK